MLSYHTHTVISSQPASQALLSEVRRMLHVESHQEGHCLAAPGQNSYLKSNHRMTGSTYTKLVGVGELGGSGRAELEQWGNECVHPAAGEEY